MSLPSPPSESAGSRKRQRSQSMSSETSSSKRAASEEPGASVLSDGRSPETASARGVPSLSPMTISGGNEDEIDSYMAEQENAQDEMDPALRGEQRQRQIDQLKNEPLALGQTWYLVSAQWLAKWYAACSGVPSKSGAFVSEAMLGPVDNSALFSSPGKLKITILEETDYEVLPEAAWKLLEEWYGACEQPVPRKVISRSVANEKRIEIHPPRITLYRLVPGDGKDLSGDNEVVFETSQGAKVTDVLKAAAERLGITADPADIRAWRIDGANNHLDGLDKTGRDYPVARLDEDVAAQWPAATVPADAAVEVTGLDHGDSLVIECKDADGKWIAEPPPPAPVFHGDFFAKFGAPQASASRSITIPKSTSSTTSNAVAIRGRPTQPTIKRGTMGLVNLGNTCFMNSALQCLAHTQELTEYFLSGVYKDELNPTNPLGMQGAIAEAFGALLQRLYETGSSSTAPRDFKTALQRFAPQFIGYQQHDSQELLAFLLDGLHEDLNRILKKPYVENPDWEGGGDKELIQLARTTWEGYLKRNDSVIVDLFQGQYKSTLICPECDKVSITFDPFMYLTLPLPVDRRWSHTINFIPLDLTAQALLIPIDLHANSTVRDIKQTLGRWLNKEPQNMQVLEVWSHKVYKLYEDSHMVFQIQKSDAVVCFEMPCRVNAHKKAPWPEDHIIVPIYHRIARPTKFTYASSYQSFEQFGQPILVAFTLEEAKDPQLMYNALVKQYSRWTEQSRHLYTWAPAGGVAKPTEVTPAEDATQVTEYPETTQVTEFRENGEVVTTEEEKPIVNGTSAPETDKMEVDDTIECLGPKQELFTLHIFPTTGEFDTQPALGKEASWDDRQREMEAAMDVEPDSQTASSSKSASPSPAAVNPPFGYLRRGDIIACEWQPPQQQFFFGEKDKDAMWARLERFVHPEYTKAQEEAEAKKNRTLNLDDCLDEFTREEKLGEDDLWYCPRCKKHQQATKKFELWKLPDILVVHLKRFSNSRTLRDKIETLVDFPTEGLDLEARVGERQALKALAAAEGVPEELKMDDMDEPLVYDLYGVDEHMGGLGGGHYRAYAKNPEDDLWYHYDDSHVSRSQAKEAVTAYAYLLFYRRRTKRPIGGKSHEKIDAARSKAPEEPTPDAPEQLPTPNDSPPRYPNKRPDTPDQLTLTSTDLNSMKSPFDTPGTSPATPADEDDISSAYDPLAGSTFGPMGLPASALRQPASPSSSMEADWDSDEVAGRYVGRPYTAQPLGKAFRGAGTPAEWEERNGSPRSPVSDDRSFDERVTALDSDTVDALRRHNQVLFGDEGGDPQ